MTLPSHRPGDRSPQADTHRTVESLFHCERSREARRIIEQLQQRGFVAYLAGGCVRDALLGFRPKDFDVATDATPESICQIFGKRHTIAFGAAFGVIGVLPPRHWTLRDPNEPSGRRQSPEPTEVATFRSDGTYSDGRRPDSVHFGNAKQDALRRDFTINGMFYDPVTHQVIDYVAGRADIEAGILRTIGDPEQRFDEDKLRMLRAVRFATVLKFQKETQTFEAIRKHATGIQVVSGERIGAEMRRIVAADDAVEGLRQLIRTGLAPFVWPGLQAVDLDVAGELLRQLPRRSFPAALSCVLLAAPAPDPMLQALAQRWKLSNEEQRIIKATLQNWYTVASAKQRSWSEVQPVLIHRDIKTIVDVAEACVATGFGGDGKPRPDAEAISLVREALAWPAAQLDPEPLLTGDDLKRLQLAPGPAYRRILARVRSAQLDGEVTSREEAIELARQWK